ncbi:MAG: transglycosylase SLT domain-containing protein, partial [Candidatus Dormibacteraeota bacterium]|nr:transglycosylase SLT domain-containing protein [Candidatus Dormibacteraeota bacterium]
PAAATAPIPNYPPGTVQEIIVQAFSPYGPGAVQWGLRVARCESNYHPGSINPSGPYYGIFQFLTSTFVNTAKAAGMPYTGANIMDPVAQSNVAAWKWAHGGAGAWGCN